MSIFSKDFGPYEIILMNMCYYNSCHGHAAKGLWALQNNIIKSVMVML
jgi:hypothetical protein